VSDQTISLIVGFLVVVGFRLLDWAFPKGYVWKAVQKWSVKKEEDDDDDETSIRPRSPSS
jgi:hypothetical protein